MKITGVEPLLPLYEQALHTIEAKGLSCRILIENKPFQAADYSRYERFDVVLGIDTFCYFPDRYELIKDVKRLLHPSGRIVFTDLTAVDPNNPDAIAFFSKYNLTKPLGFEDYRKVFTKLSCKVLRYENITERFLGHWRDINKRVLTQREEIVSATDQEAYESYLYSTTVILNAVERGGVGYVIGILEAA